MNSDLRQYRASNHEVRLEGLARGRSTDFVAEPLPEILHPIQPRLAVTPQAFPYPYQGRHIHVDRDPGRRSQNESLPPG